MNNAKLPLIVALGLLAGSVIAQDEELLIIEDDTELLIVEEDSVDDTVAEELLILEEDDSASDPALVIEDEIPNQTVAEVAQPDSAGANFKINDLWLEYGNFTDSDARYDHQGYLHVGAEWLLLDNSSWEIKLSGRVDGYSASGDSHSDDLSADYGESYIRYKSSSSIVTVGAQKVLWGRIDEFPPTDRLSTQDLRRLALDDLADRRLASLALRWEQFFGNSKLDLVAYPDFRGAELPEEESAWFPINRDSGEILGLETTPALEAIARVTPLLNNEPSTDGGAGARFSTLGSNVDFGLSVQRGLLNVPYFRYNPTDNVLESVYTRSWIVGTDFAFEALGGAVKFEGTWLSDTPVTELNGAFDTVESINWGAAWEVFPGDGDARLNIQIVGMALLNAPEVLDKSETYAINGSWTTPFADDQWRFKARVYAGLKDDDFYFNPELTYTGREGHEIYLEMHLLGGDKGTIGGFYEDNTLVTLGWRATF